MSPAVIAAAFNVIDLTTKIVMRRQAGEITEQQALEALAVAQQGVEGAFDRFADAPDGSA